MTRSREGASRATTRPMAPRRSGGIMRLPQRSRDRVRELQHGSVRDRLAKGDERRCVRRRREASQRRDHGLWLRCRRAVRDDRTRRRAPRLPSQPRRRRPVVHRAAVFGGDELALGIEARRDERRDRRAVAPAAVDAVERPGSAAPRPIRRRNPATIEARRPKRAPARTGRSAAPEHPLDPRPESARLGRGGLAALADADDGAADAGLGRRGCRGGRRRRSRGRRRGRGCSRCRHSRRCLRCRCPTAAVRHDLVHRFRLLDPPGHHRLGRNPADPVRPGRVHLLEGRRQVGRVALGELGRRIHARGLQQVGILRAPPRRCRIRSAWFTHPSRISLPEIPVADSISVRPRAVAPRSRSSSVVVIPASPSLAAFSGPMPSISTMFTPTSSASRKSRRGRAVACGRSLLPGHPAAPAASRIAARRGGRAAPRPCRRCGSPGRRRTTAPPAVSVTIAPARSAMSPAAATSQADIPADWTNASNRPLAT